MFYLRKVHTKRGKYFREYLNAAARRVSGAGVDVVAYGAAKWLYIFAGQSVDKIRQTMTVKMLFRPAVAMLLLSTLASCSAERRFHRRLVGTWEIARYEQRFGNGETELASDLGTVTFRKNGSGTNDISVLTRGVRQPDAGDFSWRNTTEEVTIISRNSYLAKSWIVMKNTRSSQVWKSTTQANVQTMELRKAN